MGGYFGLVVLVGVTLHLTTGKSELNCQGVDGHPGEAGILGRNGRPGPKGEKGEPALNSSPVYSGVLLGQKGETGSQGRQGVMGPKGYRGEVGPAGPDGEPGERGPDGRNMEDGGTAQQTRSAFSVIRTNNRYPPINQVVTYQTTVLNTAGDFDANTGIFTCQLPGVYYFSFHSVAKVSMCLKICTNALDFTIGFCDYNRNSDQVLSGGVVLELTAGQWVHLKSFKDEQRDSETKNMEEKQIIFNGFLIFSNSE